jgi:hypothetical protein
MFERWIISFGRINNANSVWHACSILIIAFLQNRELTVYNSWMSLSQVCSRTFQLFLAAFLCVIRAINDTQNNQWLPEELEGRVMLLLLRRQSSREMV